MNRKLPCGPHSTQGSSARTTREGCSAVARWLKDRDPGLPVRESQVPALHRHIVSGGRLSHFTVSPAWCMHYTCHSEHHLSFMCEEAEAERGWVLCPWPPRQ